MKRNLLRCAAVGLLLLPVCAQAAPDLTGTVAVTKGALDSGSGLVEVTFDVAITNQGDAACPGEWWADFWPDYTCACDQPAGGCGQNHTILSTDYPILQPGDSIDLQFVEHLPPNNLPFAYLLFVDSVFALPPNPNMCGESNELNNLICGEYEIPVSLKEANLEAVSCVAVADAESPSDVRFTATIRNAGEKPTANTVYVDFFLDGPSDACDEYLGLQGDVFAQVPAGLQPGQTVEVISGMACAPGDHLPACFVNAFKEIQEADYCDNLALAESHQCVAYDENPDLVVSQGQVTYDLEVPVYSGSIANIGVSDVLADTPFKLGIWFNSASEPPLNTCPDVLGGEGLVKAYDGLAADGTIDFGMSGPPLENGFYKVWFKVDCDNEVLELDEKNNTFAYDLLVEKPGPDLELTSLETTLTENAKGFSVRYTLWVTNIGSDPVSQFDVDLFWHSENGVPVFPDVPDDGEYILVDQPLDPEGTAMLEFVWKVEGGVPPGTYNSCAVIDLLNEVIEVKESNNGKCFEVVVPEFIPGFPNLSVSQFTADGVVNNAEYHIAVTNNGDKDLNAPFRIDLFVDQDAQPILGDLGDYYQEFPGLAVGESVTWTKIWENAPPGEYRAYLVVDTDSRIQEGVEADNFDGPRIVVICDNCNQCPEGKYLGEACNCGGETVKYGFCCDGEWYAVGCPDGTVESDGDVAAVEAGGMVEFDEPGFGAPESCGCRVHAVSRFPAGPALLLLLAALALLRARRRAL